MPLEIRLTGIPGLDTVLGGGLPRGSVLMIAGAPGTGKTILAQQFCFRWAATGDPGSGAGARKALYFSTLSEPHDKLIAHTESFRFFDPQELGRGVEILSLQSFLESGLEATSVAIVRQARQSQAGLVVIDGFRALETLTENRKEIRSFLYRLSAQLSILGTTVIITVERSPDDAESFGEFTTADGVIGLYNLLAGAQQRRRLEVRKLRGMRPLPGLHTYEITDAGCEIYPRLESLITREMNTPYTGGRRLPFDLAELDHMLSGGLPPGSATLIAGSLGTGKTLLGLYFLIAGLRRGEPGLFIGFHESRQQLLAKARTFHLDLESHLESGLLTLHTLAPVELEPDRISALLRQEVERAGIRRLVIDAIDNIEQPAAREQRDADYSAALESYLRSQDVTTLLLKETTQMVSPELNAPDSPLAKLCENLLLLGYTAYQATLYRIIAVIKMRDSAHDRSIREFSIDESTGLTILERGDSATGVLAGISSQLGYTGGLLGAEGPGRAGPAPAGRRRKRPGSPDG